MDIAAGKLLDEIGLKHKTDKSSAHHNYLQLYGRLLNNLREIESTILEIGVFEGASTRMWRDFLPFAKIVGMDLTKRPGIDFGEGVNIEIADQSNIEHLLRIGQTHGPFDLIVDDGSHIWDHQITTLRYLFPFVKRGGFYIVEDIHTSFGSLMDHHRGAGGPTATEYLLSLASYIAAGDAIERRAIPDAFFRTFVQQIDFILFSRHTSILKRRD